MGGLGKQKAQTPPPIPIVQFYVALDGEQAGPFDMNSLQNMVAEGRLDESSLVWKEGMGAGRRPAP